MTSAWPAIDETHDPALVCWVPGADDHPDFPVQNLPFGIFDPGELGGGGDPRIGTAIGDHVLDLRAMSAAGLIDAGKGNALAAPVLNALFARPAAERLALRHQLSRLLTDPEQADAVRPHLHAASACTMHLPALIGDYTDFYVGIHHAMNVGRLFRPDNPLLPNYKHVPIGYHGRASSVRVSGTPVVRPHGQVRPSDSEEPLFVPTRRLDYELEMGVWIGEGNALGHPIAVTDAPRHVAGLCLLNDWSARDVQAWEYQPLGPFLAKNFLTSVSPWVVTAEALAPFRGAAMARPDGDPSPLPYLHDANDMHEGGFAITLEVLIETAAMREAGVPPHRLAQSSTRWMYWTIAQMVAHHSVGGCNLQPGDLLGTGTLSGPDRGSTGSLLELSLGGKEPVALPDGEMRSFLADGDRLILSARAEAPGRRSIGFGTCEGTVLAARP